MERLTTEGLALIRDADGEVYLHFGKYAVVNVRKLFPPGGIAERKFQEWLASQTVSSPLPTSEPWES